MQPEGEIGLQEFFSNINHCMQATGLHVYWQEDNDDVVHRYGEDMDQSASMNRKMYKVVVDAGLE